MRAVPVLAIIVAVGSALSGCRSWWIDQGVVEARMAALPPARSAGDGPARDPIPADASLDDYVRLALHRNAGLQAAAHRYRAALAQVPQVTALPDPMIEYVGFLEPIETRTGPQRQRFGVMQMIPWPGKLARKGDVAAAKAEAAWWMVEGGRRMVERGVTRSWFEYGFLARSIELVQGHLDLLTGLEPVVQQRIRGGGKQADLLRLQVEIGRISDELASLRANRPAVSARLAAVLSVRRRAPLPMPTLAVPATRAVDTAALQARLATGNPALAGLRHRLEAARHGVALADLGPVPSLTLGLMYMDTGPARIPNQRDSGDDPFGVRVAMNIPIQAGKYSGASRGARAMQAATEAELEDTGHRLHAEVALHAYHLDNAARQIALYRDTLLPRARQSLQLAETAYRAGAGDLLHMIDSERVLLTFERAYWRAVANYGKSRADLRALVGDEE